MSVACAVLGWLLAALLIVRSRRRLGLVADAEHELRGASTTVALAVRAMPATRYTTLLRLQSNRMNAALDDLETARTGRPPGPDRRPDLDAGLLAQLLGNLIANADEHGAGTVAARSAPAAGGLRLEIRNRDRPPRPVEPATLDTRGRGRGLRIARRAARRLGGRVRVESRAGETVAAVELPAVDLRRAA